MRHAVLAAIALFGCAGATFAADLGTPESTPVFAAVPAFNWTGAYIGGQIGSAWQRDQLTEADICRPSCLDRVTGSSRGIIGGGHVGVNWQTGVLVWQTGRVIVGLEGDVEGADLHHTTIYPLSAPDTFSSTIGWQGSIRGRLGLAIERTLFYATGGLAFAEIRHAYFESVAAISQSFSDTRTGWTVGGGLEYAITDSWTTRVEYRYTEFEDSTDVPAAVFPGFTQHHVETQHALRIGASYKF